MTHLTEVSGFCDLSAFSKVIRNVFIGTPEAIRHLEAVAAYLDFTGEIMIPAPGWDERVPARQPARVDDLI